MDRYERVIFFDGEEADDVFDLIDEYGEEDAIAHLSQWHYPGEHETSDEPGAGTSDETYENQDGYIMSWNRGLGYIGLEFDTEADE